MPLHWPAYWWSDGVFRLPHNDNAELAPTAASEAYLRWTNPVRVLHHEPQAWDEHGPLPLSAARDSLYRS